jgi:hypothetical protein
MGVGWAQVVCFSIVQSPGTRRSTAAAAICATFATPCAAALLPTSLFCLHLHQPPVLPASGCHPSNLPPCPAPLPPHPPSSGHQPAGRCCSRVPRHPAPAGGRTAAHAAHPAGGGPWGAGEGGGGAGRGAGRGREAMRWILGAGWVCGLSMVSGLGVFGQGGGEGQGRQAEPS